MAYPNPLGGGTLSDAASGYLANYMPQIWAKEVLSFVEKNLVCWPLFNNRYEKYLAGGGDTVVINPLLEVSATAVNTFADPTTYNTDQGTPVNLIINQWYEAVVGVGDDARLMGVPDYEGSVIPALGYAISKAMDTYVNTLFASADTSVGTDAVKVDYTTLQQAKYYLDLYGAPMDGRVLIIDPGTLEDLMELDVFINADYGAGGAIQKGFVGQLRPLGCDVYMTTNLYALNTNYHNAVMAHRDFLTVAKRQAVKYTEWRAEERHTTFHRADAMYGAIELRGTWGVRIKTRA
jgi:hypothetical protein